MKLKGLHFADVAEIQEAVTDELKKVQKGIFGSFSDTVWPRKSLYKCQLSLFWIKNGVFDLKKKSVLKLLDRTAYIW